MSNNRRVVWAEGVLLHQQHFQQWDRYHEQEQQLFHTHLSPYHYGVAELLWDDHLLLQGTLRLNRCLALLPDRRWVDFKREADTFLEVTIPEDSLTTRIVYLALPCSEKVSGISGYPCVMEPTALKGNYELLADVQDKSRVQEVLLATRVPRLLLDSEDKTGYTAMPIASLELNHEQKAYRLSTTYTPPLLHLKACPNLSSWWARWMASLRQHLQQIKEQKEKQAGSSPGVGIGDLLYFNLYKTLCMHYASLQGLQSLMKLHPYHLYQAAIAFVGELSGYLDEPIASRALPSFDETNLSRVFQTIEKQVDELMGLVIPTHSLDIGLTRLTNSQYQSIQLSPEMLRGKQFYLALHQEGMDLSLIDQVRAQVKVAAPSQLMNLLQSFMPGVGLTLINNPLKDLMAKPNYHYFELNKRSEGWDDIVSEGMISVFVSQALSSQRFELLAV